MAITLQGWMRYLGGNLFNTDRGTQTMGPDRPSSDAGVTVTDDVAMTIGAVFRCIRVIAEVCSLLPLRAYERRPGGDAVELPPEHWLPSLIARPNPEMSSDDFLTAMYAQEAGWGNAYAQIVRNSQGIPVELWPYKVDRMKVVRNEDLTIAYEYPDPFGTPRRLERGRVLHMKGFTVDGVMGISPLGLARNAAGLAIQAERYAGSFFASGGRPAGILTSDRILTDRQREQVREEFGSLADSTTGKRLWILEASLKYDPVTVNPDDMQLVLTRGFQVAEIARFFGVPLFLLFETEKSTSWGSGIEQQNNALKNYTLRPYAEDMAAAWNHAIIPPQDRRRYFVDVDLDGFHLADLNALGTFYGNAAQNGIMTREEIRRRLKLPKSNQDGADRLTAQANLTTLDKLGQNPQSEPATPPAVL